MCACLKSMEWRFLCKKNVAWDADLQLNKDRTAWKHYQLRSGNKWQNINKDINQQKQVLVPHRADAKLAYKMDYAQEKLFFCAYKNYYAQENTISCA